MLFSVLRKVPLKGKLDIIDSNGKTHSFGTFIDLTSDNLYSKIRFTNKSIQRKLFMNPGLYLGEGYMDGEIIIEEGTIEDFINIITSCYEDFISRNLIVNFYQSILNFLKPLHQINKIIKSKKNIEHHYDLNEKLYRLFLDRDMQYSCAYFHNENIDLDQAQSDKKKHIINKLNIKSDMNVLDIGCGWGGLSLQIAKDTGAQVKGITLSKNQLATAQKRSQEEGLNEKVHFALQDYRLENNKYDRIVSVGMFEHVGINYYPTFFSKAYELLKETGVVLLHTIGQTKAPTPTSPWMRKYIFPGGYIPSLSEILKTCENLCINVTDVEVLRLHYAHTLHHWYKNTLAHKNQIIQMFDERFFRMWEFYLLISKYSFLNMGNVVFQIQISKNINNLPLTRNYIYN